MKHTSNVPEPGNHSNTRPIEDDISLSTAFIIPHKCVPNYFIIEVDAYYFFSFEPYHKVNLGMSKLLRVFIAGWPLSDTQSVVQRKLTQNKT